MEARAEGKNASGERVEARPRWVPADPPMVTVTPGEGRDVKIAILGAGETRLVVAAEGISRDLTVKAVRKGDALSIEVSQAARRLPDAAARARLLASAAERGSYALGVDVGRRLRPRSAGLDPGLVARGLRNALAEGNTLLNEDELGAALVDVPAAPCPTAEPDGARWGTGTGRRGGLPRGEQGPRGRRDPRERPPVQGPEGGRRREARRRRHGRLPLPRHAPRRPGVRQLLQAAEARPLSPEARRSPAGGRPSR